MLCSRVYLDVWVFAAPDSLHVRPINSWCACSHLVAACFLVQPATAAQVKEVRLVHILYSEGPFNPYSTRLVQEIRTALQKSP